MRNALYILYILALLPILAYGQEGVIMDAETKEPLPFATLYVSPSCGTISNSEGEFCITCEPDDMVRISSIGYKTMWFRASELPASIGMQPISKTLKELTVTSADNLMYDLVVKMQKQAKRKRKATGQYFFRLITQYPGTDELAEAFLSAKSCVQMRDITFHSGRRGELKYQDMQGPDLKGLGTTNLHYILRLAPVLVNYDIWGNTFVPADIILKRIRDIYSVYCTSFTDDEGREIYKIVCRHNPNIKSQSILDGTLYVDRKKCQLLRFDGKLHNLALVFFDQARNKYFSFSVDYTMHVDYRHDHGFTEIASMSGHMTNEDVKLHHILFNLGEKRMKFDKAIQVGNNMLETIDRVGCDSILWKKMDIVKRTKTEERVAFGMETAPTKPIKSDEEKRDSILNSAMHNLLEGKMPLRRAVKTNVAPLPKKLGEYKITFLEAIDGVCVEKSQ